MRAGNWLAVRIRTRPEVLDDTLPPRGRINRGQPLGKGDPPHPHAAVRVRGSLRAMLRSIGQVEPKNSIRPAIERSAISAVSRASRMMSSDIFTGWLIIEW